MAAALGAALMLLVVAAIAISYARMLALYDDAATGICEFYPAHNELLFSDRDFYQAELALERGASLENPVDRRGQPTVFRETVEQTETRFARFRGGSEAIPDRMSAINSYID